MNCLESFLIRLPLVALERALRGTSPAADESAAPWKGKGVDADDDDTDLNEPTTPAATVQSHRHHPADDS